MSSRSEGTFCSEYKAFFFLVGRFSIKPVLFITVRVCVRALIRDC